MLQKNSFLSLLCPCQEGGKKKKEPVLKCLLYMPGSLLVAFIQIIFYFAKDEKDFIFTLSLSALWLSFSYPNPAMKRHSNI
jgi:hypothetical protein